jgi:hypothetical protein
MRLRICRKTKDGFESQEFLDLASALEEKKKSGGFIDEYDEKLCCWVQYGNGKKRK